MFESIDGITVTTTSRDRDRLTKKPLEVIAYLVPNPCHKSSNKLEYVIQMFGILVPTAVEYLKM